MSFFALSLPPNESTFSGDQIDSKPINRVFQSREEALKALKLNKNSRLKTFVTEEEAVKFACDPNESPPVSSNEELKFSITSLPVGEGCPYKGLTPQEMKCLKQSIMDEDEDAFDRLLAANPRYLMSPCDTPSVLHSGTRSNALHIAALSGSLKMTLKVIDAIQDPDLMIRMYPGESGESRSKRQEYLFDMYMNTPKKGDFDTPLHQASKYGHLDVVKLLSGYSSCDTKRKNKEGQTPAEVACSRMKQPIDLDVKRRILETLSEHVYIPVFRTMDLSTPAYIGEPWSPSSPLKPSMDFTPVQYPGDESSPQRPMSPFGRSPSLGSPLLVANRNSSSHPNSPRQMMEGEQDPLTSPLTVRALLGPVSPVDAAKIQQEWRKNSAASKLLRLADPLKGLERQGRSLARKYQTGILEYWDFINAYADLTTPEGLALLENHLTLKFQEFDEEEARKIFELERDLADLNIDSKDQSFVSTQQPGPELRGLNKPELKASTQFLLNGDTYANTANLSSFNQPRMNEPQFPLSRQIIWNQVRETDNNSSLDSSGLTESDLDNSIMNGGDNLQQRSQSPASLNSSFHSAASSLNESMMTADESMVEGMVIYLEGLRPSQTDCQVFRALENVDVKPETFPMLNSWMNVIAAHPEEERSKWKSVKPIIKQVRHLEGARKLTFED